MQRCIFLRSFLALVLFTTALQAAAQINPGFDPATPIRVVYRVDFTSPYDAFTDGFTPRGTVGDLLSLTSGAPCNNAPQISNVEPSNVTLAICATTLSGAMVT